LSKTITEKQHLNKNYKKKLEKVEITEKGIPVVREDIRKIPKKLLTLTETAFKSLKINLLKLTIQL